MRITITRENATKHEKSDVKVDNCKVSTNSPFNSLVKVLIRISALFFASRISSDVSRIVPFSKMATVLVGPEKQPFTVPQDLLNLHSSFFRQHFARADQNIVLPTVDAVLFAEFVAWLYFLELSAEPEDGIYVDDHDARRTVLDRSWALGSFLGAPSYQKTQMKDYQDYCRGSSYDWPDILSIRTIYEVTPAGSKLRNFAADSIATQSPFKRHASGSPEFAEWNELLLQFPEMTLDVIHARCKRMGWLFTLGR